MILLIYEGEITKKNVFSLHTRLMYAKTFTLAPANFKTLIK